MESLFSNERIDFDLPDVEVIYFLSYLNNNEATELFQHFKCKIKLENGSLLLMRGSTLHFYKRQIPKATKIILPIINLTFLSIKMF